MLIFLFKFNNARMHSQKISRTSFACDAIMAVPNGHAIAKKMAVERVHKNRNMLKQA